VTDTGTTGSTTAPAPLAAILEVEEIDVGYAVARALFGVSLQVGRGEVLAVLGPNGAGKSTLARAVSGLVPTRAGTITFDGADITRWPPHRIRRAGLVHIPEGRGVFPGLTVAENVRMAVRRVGSAAERDTGIERAYELFPALGKRQRQRAGSLSGGEQQMLALARALAVPPKLVIADEMSLGLAPIIVDEVFQGIAQARREGVTILLIEQFVHRALALADTCVVLSQGHVAWSGRAEDAKDEVLERYLGEGESL
jgi:branched-chain amino acid transport system ATP-binding protein